MYVSLLGNVDFKLSSEQNKAEVLFLSIYIYIKISKPSLFGLWMTIMHAGIIVDVFFCLPEYCRLARRKPHALLVQKC